MSDTNLLLYGFDSNALTMGVDHIWDRQERISGGIGLRVFNNEHNA